MVPTTNEAGEAGAPGDERPPTMAEIGRALGLSRQAVSKAAKEGMPTHSIPAAHAWRLANLDPSRRKRGAYDAELKAREAVARADALLGLAVQALRADPVASFLALVPTLRQALAGVPEACRGRVCIPVEVMERLCADSIRYTLTVEAEWAAAGINQEDTAPDDPAPWYQRSIHAFPDGRSRYTPEDLRPHPWGWLWYGVAIGEVRHDWIDC